MSYTTSVRDSLLYKLTSPFLHHTQYGYCLKHTITSNNNKNNSCRFGVLFVVQLLYFIMTKYGCYNISINNLRLNGVVGIFLSKITECIQRNSV